MDAFLLSFGVIFLAELGDKSQLMAMAFATRYRALTVLVAVTVATLLVHAFSVLVGVAVRARAADGRASRSPPARVPRLRRLDASRGRRWARTTKPRGPSAGVGRSLTIGTAFFLAELGDKTMLATITLATDRGAARDVARVDGRHGRRRRPRDRLGALLGARLPERAIRIFAAGAFVVFGAILVAQGTGLA